MWFREIFQTRSKQLDKLCNSVYKENIRLIYYFLREKCQISDDECHIVVKKSIYQMVDNIKDYRGMKKRKQNEKFFYDTYEIAKEIYPNIKEVRYDSKKDKE